MFWEVLSDSDDAIVLSVRTFSEGIKKVCFVPSDEIDTILVLRKESPLGLFNRDFKKKAVQKDIWDILLGHESLHCCSEFIAPWYAPIDILPEAIPNTLKTLIPNAIEDLVINHTLWLWEENPMRSAGYVIPNFTERLIKCCEELPQHSIVPSPLAAVVELIGQSHLATLKSVLNQRKGNRAEAQSILLKNIIHGNIIRPLAGEINGLFNSLAVSLLKEKRTVKVNLEISTKGRPNRPLYETKYDGKPIPQYIPLHLDGVRRIYDLFDIHFAEAYGMKVDTLRKDSYENYKKVIFNRKTQLSRENKSKKSIVLFPKIYRENNKLICDFSLQLINEKSTKLSEKKVINLENGEMEITGSELLEPWERFERMRMFELRRLQQWVDR
jgi:hypothetical protein